MREESKVGPADRPYHTPKRELLAHPLLLGLGVVLLVTTVRIALTDLSLPPILANGWFILSVLAWIFTVSLLSAGFLALAALGLACFRRSRLLAQTIAQIALGVGLIPVTCALYTWLINPGMTRFQVGFALFSSTPVLCASAALWLSQRMKAERRVQASTPGETRALQEREPCTATIVLGPSTCPETRVEPARTSAPSLEPAGLSGPGGRRQFGEYELIEEIAQGGMGVVYKAWQGRLKRMVALKMILRGPYASSVEVSRFLNEAQAAAHLDHPNIVAIHEVGQDQGQYYFSMQLIEGCSLAEQMQAGGWPLDDGTAAARLLAKVARAVHYAHQANILHRDLKPGNILIDGHGEPHIADFGLARQLNVDSSLTLESTVVGTPTFMAPEQAAGQGKQLTPASDIYSLGAILYYLLTGQPPFVAESVLDILTQVLEGEAMLPRALNPHVNRDLEQICLRCLEKSPPDRYASAAELADDLEQFLRGEPVAARCRHWGLTVRHWARQRPALVSRLCALVVCAAIAQTEYRLTHGASLALHCKVMGVLVAWAAISVFCQWAVNREGFGNIARYTWAASDAVLFTMLLYIDSAFNGPLIGLYPVLIAGSGLWFRVKLVAWSTTFSVLGYGFVLLDQTWQRGPPPQLNWHIIFLISLALTGGITSYLVHRVGALTRFTETKSHANSVARAAPRGEQAATKLAA